MPLPAVLLVLVAHVFNLCQSVCTHCFVCFVCTGVNLAKDAVKAQAEKEAAEEAARVEAERAAEKIRQVGEINQRWVRESREAHYREVRERREAEWSKTVRQAEARGVFSEAAREAERAAEKTRQVAEINQRVVRESTEAAERWVRDHQEAEWRETVREAEARGVFSEAAREARERAAREARHAALTESADSPPYPAPWGCRWELSRDGVYRSMSCRDLARYNRDLEKCTSDMSRLSMKDVSRKELESECPACLEPLHACGTLVRLKCGHVTCRCCLDAWHRQCYRVSDPEFTCMMCRGSAHGGVLVYCSSTTSTECMSD